MKTDSETLMRRLFLLILTLACCLGCRTTETVSEEKQETEEITTSSSDSLQVWKQDLLRGLKVRDSLYFFNDVEIRLEKILTDKETYVKNHEIVSIDSTLKIFDIIPARTAGVLSDEPKRGDGGINVLPLSFTKDGSIVTLFFVRKGSLSSKTTVYKNKNGKVLRTVRAPSVKNPEICIVDSVKVTIKYKEKTWNAKFLSGMGATVLVSKKENKGTRIINREAKGWRD